MPPRDQRIEPSTGGLCVRRYPRRAGGPPRVARWSRTRTGTEGLCRVAAVPDPSGRTDQARRPAGKRVGAQVRHSGNAEPGHLAVAPEARRRRGGAALHPDRAWPGLSPDRQRHRKKTRRRSPSPRSTCPSRRPFQSATGPAQHRRAAVRQHERRPGERVLQRRHRRGDPQPADQAAAAESVVTHLLVLLQGQGGRPRDDRGQAGRRHGARGQRAPGRQSRAHHRAADRRGVRLEPVGRDLRP